MRRSDNFFVIPMGEKEVNGQVRRSTVPKVGHRGPGRKDFLP